MTANGNKPDSKFSFDRVKLELRRASWPFVLLVLLWIGGIVAVADMLNDLSGTSPLKSYVSYRLAFTDLQGVTPGRVPVDVAGVNAGAITNEQMVNGQPVLTIALEQQYGPLYRNAVVQIRPYTPLDNLYMDITSRGTPSAGKLTQAEILPTSQTTFPVEISKVLDVFNANTRADLSSLLDQLGSGLQDHGTQLRDSFAQLVPFLVAAKQVAVAVNQRHQDLAQLIHYYGGMMQVLALRDRQLTSFVTSGNQTLASLANHDQPFNAMLADLPPMLANMQGAFAAVQAAESHVDPALVSLRPVAEALPGGLHSLNSFSKRATPALQALTPASERLLPFAQTLRPASGALESAVRGLDRQGPQIDRSTAEITPCEDYVAKFLEGVMSITKFGDQGANPYATMVPTARADVQLSFTEGELPGLDPYLTVTPPCFG